MTAADQPTAGVALKPLYGSPNYLQDPDGLARIRESLIQTPDWHDPAPINCNSLARLLDTIEALRTPASGAVEAARKGLQSILDDFDRENADDIDNDDFNVGQDEHIEVPTASLRRVLAALTSEPKAEGEDEARRDAWSDFEDDHLTDGKGNAAKEVYDRCRSAFDAAWPNGRQNAMDAALAALKPPPQPLQGGEVTRALVQAGAVMDALWPILGGNHTSSETWTEIGKAVRSALISPAQREGEG